MATNLKKNKSIWDLWLLGLTPPQVTVLLKPGTQLCPHQVPDVSALKLNILASIKADISVVIKSEMKAALVEDFAFTKCELKAMRAEVANGTKAFCAEKDQVKLCSRC